MKSCLTLLLAITLIACGSEEENEPTPIVELNSPPQLTMPVSQTITSESTVVLEATATDENTEELSYLWVQTEGPTVDLQNVNGLSASFSTENIYESTELSFSLSVTDNQGEITTGDTKVEIQLQSITLTPDESYYEPSTEFEIGQIVILKSESTTLPSTLLSVTNEELVIELILEEDGTILTWLPDSLSEGEWEFRSKVGEHVTHLQLKVRLSDPIAQPINVVSDQFDLIIAQLESTQQSLAVRDTQIDTLLEDLTNIALADINSQELEYLARIILANQMETIFSSIESSQLTQSRSSLNLSSCLNITTKMTLAGTLVVLSSGGAAVAPGIGKILFLGVGVASAYKFLELGDSFFQQDCLGLASFSEVSFDSPSQTLQKLSANSHHAKHIKTNDNINWYDADEKSLSITYLNSLPQNSLDLLNQLSIGLSKLGTFAPTDTINWINRLKAPREVDVTEDVKLEWTNTDTVECDGTVTALTCHFPLDDEIYEEEMSIDIEITHPLVTENSEFSITVVPRDKPVVDDQTFEVIAGFSRTNIIKLEYLEDTQSDFYPLTKISDFEFTNTPEWGVIRNDFNQLGIFEYAADEGDARPDSVALTVRAVNRYGWSETFTVTLRFVFSIDLTGMTAISTITNSDCPDTKGGWSYSFSATTMSISGSDSWDEDCDIEPSESGTITMTNLAPDYDIPFNCLDFPICRLNDLQKTIIGIDEDGRNFTSTYTFNEETGRMTYTKVVPNDDASFREVIFFEW